MAEPPTPTLYMALAPKEGAGRIKASPGTYEVPLDNFKKMVPVSDRIGIPVASQGSCETMMLAMEADLGGGLHRIRIVYSNGEDVVDARQIAAKFYRFTSNDVAMALGDKSIHLFSTIKHIGHRLGVPRTWMTRIFVEKDVVAADVRSNKIWVITKDRIQLKDLPSMGTLADRTDAFGEDVVPFAVVAMTNGCEAIVAVRSPDDNQVGLLWLKAEPLSGTIEKNDLNIGPYTLEGTPINGRGTLAFMVRNRGHQRSLCVVSADDETVHRVWSFPAEVEDQYPSMKCPTFALSGSVHFNGVGTYVVPFIWNKTKVGVFTCMNGFDRLQLDSLKTKDGLECTHVVVSPKVEPIDPNRMVVLYNSHLTNGVIARLNAEVEATCMAEVRAMGPETGSTYTLGRIAAYSRKVDQLKTEISAKDKQIAEHATELAEYAKREKDALLKHKEGVGEIGSIRKKLTKMTSELASAKMKTIEEAGGVTQKRFDEEVGSRKRVEIERDAAIVARKRVETARDDLDERLRALKTKKAEADRELEQLRRKVKKQAAEIGALQAVQDDRTALQSQVQSLRDRLRLAERGFKLAQEGHTQKMDDLRAACAAEVKALKKENNDLRSSLGVATKVADKAAKTEAEATERIRALEEQLTAAETKARESGITRDALIAKMTTMEQLKPDAVQMRIDRVRAEAKHQLEATQTDLDRHRKESAKHKKEATKHKRELEKLREEAQKMKVEPAKPTKDGDVDAELQAAIKRLEQDLDTATADKNSLVRQMGSSQYALDQLTARNYTMAQELAFAHQCLQGYLPTGTDLPTALQQLQSLDMFQRDLALSRMHATNLEAQLHAALNPPQEGADQAPEGTALPEIAA